VTPPISVSFYNPFLDTSEEEQLSLFDVSMQYLNFVHIENTSGSREKLMERSEGEEKEDDFDNLGEDCPLEVLTKDERSMMITGELTKPDTLEKRETFILVDSGAVSSYIDADFVANWRLQTRPLERAYTVRMADGQKSSGGLVNTCCELMLRIGDHYEKEVFDVTALGSHEILLGYRWLKVHNPDINWSAGTLEFTRCPRECLHSSKENKNTSFSWDSFTDNKENNEGDEEEERCLPQEEDITKIMKLSEVCALKEQLNNLYEKIPKAFWEYVMVFDKGRSERLPE
jgi:hypothetical protein